MVKSWFIQYRTKPYRRMRRCSVATSTIDAYVVYRLSRKEQRKAICHFSHRNLLKNKAKTQIKESPVFLEKKQAVDYLKYIDISECLVKVRIPESAIVGKYGELEITTDRLDYCHIQDYYLS